MEERTNNNPGPESFFSKAIKYKKTLITILALGIFSLTFFAFAATLTKPHQFAAGQPISASQLNENFDLLYNESNAQNSRLAALESGLGGITNTPPVRPALGPALRGYLYLLLPIRGRVARQTAWCPIIKSQTTRTKTTYAFLSF